MRVRIIAVIIICSLSSSVNAGSGAIVAVFDIEDKGVGLKKSLLEGLTDYLSTRVAELGGFQVIPRGEMKKRLSGSKASSYKKCYDQSCQIELGKELAAEKILATKLIKLGSKCTVTSTLYDIKKSVTESAATVHGKCREDDIVASLDKTVLKLMKMEKPSRGEVTTISGAKMPRNTEDNCRSGVKIGSVKKDMSYRQVVDVLGNPDSKIARKNVGGWKLTYMCKSYQPIPKPEGCRIYLDSKGRVTICYGCDVCE